MIGLIAKDEAVTSLDPQVTLSPGTIQESGTPLIKPAADHCRVVADSKRLRMRQQAKLRYEGRRQFKGVTLHRPHGACR